MDCRVKKHNGKTRFLTVLLTALLAAGMLVMPVQEVWGADGTDTAAGAVSGEPSDTAAAGTGNDPAGESSEMTLTDAGDPADTAADAAAVPLAGTEVVFAENDNYANTKYILIPFPDTATVPYEWSFPYSDNFFRHSSAEFSQRMAQASLGLATSAFRSTAKVVKPQYETYLREAGFENIHTFGYDRPTTQDSLSGVIGSKKIDGRTVIAAAGCGQGYGTEWAGNVEVGYGDIHEGFSKAAAVMEKQLKKYIRKNNIKGSKVLWVAGFSRASAVGNLVAANAIESGAYEDVYAYLFGVPRTTKKPVRYQGIYNICGQYDPIPQTPLQSWGFERYGTDLYTPAQESTSGYPRLAKGASKVSRALCGKPFRNNPELNFQYHLILEFMGEFFPTSEEYAERFQDILMKKWTDPDNKHNITAILSSAMIQMEEQDAREKQSSAAFIQYMTMIAGEHTRANQPQVLDGSWDPSDPLAANAVLEHRPSTYLKWLFNDEDIRDILHTSDAAAGIAEATGAETVQVDTAQADQEETESTENADAAADIPETKTHDTTRRITILGDVRVEIYSDALLLGFIDTKGIAEYIEADDPKNDEFFPKPFMMRNGSATIVSLPTDRPYRLVVRSSGKNITSITYSDITFHAESLRGTSGQLYLCSLKEGKYAMEIMPGEELPELEAVSGDLFRIKAQKYDYSPVDVMKTEAIAGEGAYLSIGMILGIVSLTVVILFILLLICLFVFVWHHWQRHRGHPPYSNLYVIIPHLFFAAVFMGLTLFLTYYMFTIGQARAECAAVAVVFVFLLAARGTIRRRELPNLIVTAFLAAMIFLTHRYYSVLPQGESFNAVNVICYCGCMAILCILATRTFYGFRRKPKPAAGPADDKKDAVDLPQNGV